MFALGNLGNRYFWSDEASSFFTALGFPASGQEAAGWAEAWAANKSGLEPGMFNWLERFWALGFGTDIVTLRFFPLVIFLSYLAALLILTRLTAAPLFIGCAVIGLMLLENITPYYAVELRPSIAGLAAAVAIPLVAIWLTVSRTVLTGLAVFLPVFVILGSMQYNSLPIMAGVAALLVLAALRQERGPKRITMWVMAIFTLVWLPLLYVLIMGNPFDLIGGDALKNIPEAYIPNMPAGEALRVVATNFFSPTALPRTIFILVVPILWLLKKYPTPKGNLLREQWVVVALWVIVVVSTIVTSLLGVLGFIPWILGTRWSISEVGLIGLSLVGLAGLVAQSRLLKVNWMKLVVVLVSLIVVAAGSIRLATYERTAGTNWNQALEVILAGKPGSTYIDLWSYPELRYWVEYSGQYDQFKDQWIAHDVQIAGPGDKAGPEDIEAFFNSTADRLLLRSGSLLEGIQIPGNIELLELATWKFPEDEQADSPVLLIRN